MAARKGNEASFINLKPKASVSRLSTLSQFMVENWSVKTSRVNSSSRPLHVGKLADGLRND